MPRKRWLFGAAGLTLAGALAIPAVRRRLWARGLGLPPARYAVRIARDVAVPIGDGVQLLADHYAPAVPGRFATVLIRSPYGKGREAPPFGTLVSFQARCFAERGYNVLVQTTRGRYSSGGTFDPLAHERADGLATLEWLRAQPWYDGRLATFGASYLGYVQWAIAADAQPDLKAMLPIVTGAQLGSLTHIDGAFGFDTLLHWATLNEQLGGELARAPSLTQSLFGALAIGRRVLRAFSHLPLAETDAQVVGQPIGFYQDWLRHTDLSEPYWQHRDHTARVPAVAAPVHFVSGWYDVIQRELLADYAALQQAGRAPYLTIGPWAHTNLGLQWASLREGLRWFDQQLQGAAPAARKPVRLFVLGAGTWREFDSWPPPAPTTAWFLQPGGGLGPAAPADSPPDHYRYDPSDPTPCLGGARLPGQFSGPRDQRTLEARTDLLCYTSAPLERDLDVIGPVRLVLFVRSSLAHTDFLGRLCDVYPDGRSINICDGLLRLAPGSGARQPDGSLRIEIGLWNTACRFRRGHRLRLHVASGAHPRWSRNLGLGQPLASAVLMRVAEQAVFHDPAHPSALLLPVV